jgi:hypothetical protein
MSLVIAGLALDDEHLRCGKIGAVVDPPSARRSAARCCGGF